MWRFLTRDPHGRPPAKLLRAPKGPPPPDWVPSVILADRLGWDFDTIEAAPGWWVERAELYLTVESAWREHEHEAAMKR